MKRLINRRRQGDLGEASAIEWLTRAGATVFAPLGHSPDVDLVAQLDGRLLRVQVKTSVFREHTPNGHERYSARLSTLGGNQSWTGLVKRFDPALIDFLIVLVGDGRRWFIPADEVEAEVAISLGGLKYSEFEIERSSPIEGVVYEANDRSVKSPLSRLGEYPRGQRTAAVNRQAQPSQVRLLPPPLADEPAGPGATPTGQTRVSGNRQIVIPKRAFEAAGFERGDRLKAIAAGPGEVVFRRIAREQPPSTREATPNGNGPPRGEGRPASGTR